MALVVMGAVSVTADPVSRRTWIIAVVAEVVALALAAGLWAGGVMAGPGRFSSGSPNEPYAVLAFEAAASVVCMLVPAWIVHRTRRLAWGLVGLIPALVALGTTMVVLRSPDW